MISLKNLYASLATALDGPLLIEAFGREALLAHAEQAEFNTDDAVPLPSKVVEVMQADDAHPCCKALVDAPLPWAPPLTVDDPAYVEVSKRKVLVELIGPAGLVKSDKVRMGVYGIRPNVEYGIRTHPAEELFVMIAGKADWLRGDEDYAEYGTGARRHHPSMMQHATRTRASAFMSIYVWSGDVSFRDYIYSGTTNKE